MSQNLAMPIKATPFQHQRDAFDFACGLFGLTGQPGARSPGVAYLMDMGTGKTLTAIAVAGALYRAGHIRRALVVAPLSVLGVWREEFDKFADFPNTLAVLTGKPQKKANILSVMTGQILQVVVINYESAWRLEKELRVWQPQLIVTDEGHRLKSRTAAVSKAMHRLGAAASYRILMTGTPIVCKALDVFSEYKFLNPEIFGSSFPAFKLRYLRETGYGGYTLVLRPEMEPEFTRRLHSIAFRATKAECLDLPETVDIIRPVELESAARKIYKELVNESYVQLGDGEVSATNVLSKLLRLSQLTGGFITDDSGEVQQVSRAKLDALSDIVDEAEYEGRKLVIMARFIPEIGAICEMLNARGINHVCVRGGTTSRDEKVAKFQLYRDVRVFVGQIAAAGLGITLTAADTMVFYSLDYNAANHEQARARIHRVGQQNQCTYIYLTATATTDVKILKALRDKADLARVLVDEYRRGVNPFEGGPVA